MRNFFAPAHLALTIVILVWDIVLAIRLGKLRLPLVYGLATDDAHGYHTFAINKANPGRGWIMVKAPFLSAERFAGQFGTPEARAHMLDGLKKAGFR